MPLLTQIVKSEEFTAVKLAGLWCDAAGCALKYRNPADMEVQINRAQYVLDQLKASGVIA